ncbi:hypothetical protein [Flavobacterium hungaricum]|uniref:hypothetical protein n=1 Tax=Flavobacterium hungaricum TaxID=2082725 RepID=UPI0018839563|nr:hypothetical protein [Flavobacterium hungaricum]
MPFYFFVIHAAKLHIKQICVKPSGGFMHRCALFSKGGLCSILKENAVRRSFFFLVALQYFPEMIFLFLQLLFSLQGRRCEEAFLV